MSTERVILNYQVEGTGETIEEMMEMQKEDRNQINLVQWSKWGYMALDMLKLANEELCTTLTLEDKLRPFITRIDEECVEMNTILREQMQPKSTDDWLTNWQNIERMSSQIEEIIIHKVIEPIIMVDID